MAGRIGKPCPHCGRFCGEGEAVAAVAPRRRPAAAVAAPVGNVAASSPVALRPMTAPRPSMSRALLAILAGVPLGLFGRRRLH